MILPVSLSKIGPGWQICLCTEERSTCGQLLSTSGTIIYVTQVKLDEWGAKIEYLELIPKTKNSGSISPRKGYVPLRDGFYRVHELRVNVP